ncbi:MAG: adenosylcobinamide amidohydrolase [Deltaproteobacteria bacterium]|nr:adenosylcobinamide amidohydrolase [Deltaproteobacteria bacterium]
MKPLRHLAAGLLFLAAACLPARSALAAPPLQFTDSRGQQVTIAASPRRVVSLVPAITEMILRLGAADRLVGLTYHSVLPPASAGKAVVGGFLHPDPELVAALHPDLVFCAALQQPAMAPLAGRVQMVDLESRTIAEAFAHLRLLGEIFNRQAAAAAIIAEEKRQLRVIAAKVAKIPPGERQRVARFIGAGQALMVPGDDSFQNEYIRAAGGRPPVFGKKGPFVTVSPAAWRRFNPQVIYGCESDRQAVKILQQPGWREVDAVKNGRIFFFPCDLTCRAATHEGYFVSWLAARIYRHQFEQLANNVLPEKVIGKRPLEIGLDYIRQAEIIDSDIRDFRNRTLVLEFKRPLAVVSTLEGERRGITRVANHYFPPPSWGLGHHLGLAGLRSHTLEVLGLPAAKTAILFTGADMNNLAVVHRSFRDLTVYALVTAGVHSNAVRMAEDIGRYYEPGTINIILLSNARLSRRAMTRALISATEAKSCALADLDIRSSYTGKINRATGTGTDNIIVVAGEGVAIDNTGGHAKMGELIARAVHQGVIEAIYRQNGIVARRPVFQRLAERGVDLFALTAAVAPAGRIAALHQEVERLLLQPRYAGFLETAMAISDDCQRHLVCSLETYDRWCQTVAGEIAGGQPPAGLRLPAEPQLPPALEKALEALYRGALARLQTRKK